MSTSEIPPANNPAQETPETDAFDQKRDLKLASWREDYEAAIDFARTLEKRLATARLEVEVKTKALENLTKAARRVSEMGAQTGPQWPALSVAILGALSALTGEKGAGR